MALDDQKPFADQMMLANQTTTLSPTGSETLDVGGWQVVVTDGHAVLPEA